MTVKTKQKQNPSHGGETVTVLPESDAHTLCVKLTGTIRREDHLRNLAANLERMVRKHGWYNLIGVYGEDYRGWEVDAADLSMQTIIDYGKFARKLAYVHPPERKITLHKTMPQLFGGETRYFDSYAEALRWVKS